jgi:hypothetical protein
MMEAKSRPNVDIMAREKERQGGRETERETNTHINILDACGQLFAAVQVNIFIILDTL